MRPHLPSLVALVLCGALAAPALALELQRMQGSEDGEDQQHWLYFHSDTVHFALAGSKDGDTGALRYPSLALFMSDGRDPQDLEPSPADYVPDGQIDPQQVWLDRDQRLIVLLVGDGEARRWHYVDAARARLVAQTPVRPADLTAGPSRVLPEPLPAALAGYDHIDVSDWRSLVRPDQRGPVMQWRSRTRAQFDGFRFDVAQATLREQVDGWISAYSQPATAKDLLGDWQVRSVQLSELGVFDYPWFKARIDQPAGGGPLRFAKTSGSQRRSGLLVGDPAVPDRLVFVGARSVNDEPARTYSRLQGVDAEPTNSDSLGEFLLLAPGHAVMILDAQEDAARGFEVYELKRP